MALATLVGTAALAKEASASLKADARAALAALAKSDWPRVVAHLDAALLSARENAPLSIDKLVVVRGPPAGLGVYDPAPNHEVSDREVWLYVEVANFGNRAIDPETWKVELSVSGTFSLEGSAPIGTMSLGKHEMVTRTKHGLTFFGPNVKLSPKAPAGAYVVDVEVFDEVSGKRAKRKIRFVIP
jgi:hypothetical protein